MKRHILLLALLHSPFASAQPNAIPDSPHIVVYGAAEATAIPDNFRINLAFNVHDQDLSVARDRLSTLFESVVRSLLEAGVEANAIQASSASIGAWSEWDQQTRSSVYKGHQFNRQLSATFIDEERLEDFLASLQTSRELTVTGVETRISTLNEMRKALRLQSIEEARRKAEIIAGQLGARVTSVYGASDVAPQFQYGISEGDWPSRHRWNGHTLDRIEVTGSRIRRADIESASPAFNLLAGEEYFEDRIYVVFLIEPARG